VHGCEGRESQRLRRHHQGCGRLARNHEHALVHDHMFSFTAQNVYKGDAGMFNIYSALDRGNEAINDGVNLRLPSGTAKTSAISTTTST